jgi:hypothetical protein
MYKSNISSKRSGRGGGARPLHVSLAQTGEGGGLTVLSPGGLELVNIGGKLQNDLTLLKLASARGPINLGLTGLTEISHVNLLNW